jgi:ATP-dependent DNA helicase RecG
MPTEKRQWQETAAKFALYPQMTLQQRQHLVADTRRFVYQLQQDTQRRNAEGAAATSPSQSPKVKTPRTHP